MQYIAFEAPEILFFGGASSGIVGGEYLSIRVARAKSSPHAYQRLVMQ